MSDEGTHMSVWSRRSRDPSPMSQKRTPRRTAYETRPNQVSPEAQQQLPVDPVESDTVMEDRNINDSSLEVWLSTPPLYEYISLAEWLKSNFDSYFKAEF